MSERTVIFEETGAEPGVERFDVAGWTFVASDGESLARAAVAAERWGAVEVQLCGGVSLQASAAVAEALGGRVVLGTVGFDSASLRAAAEYNARFGEGELGAGAFLLLAPGAGTQRVVREADGLRTTIVAVPDVAAGVAAARELAAEGVTLIELYGAFDGAGAAAVRAAVPEGVAVGHVSYRAESLPAVP